MQNTNEYVTDLGHLHLRIEEILDERGLVKINYVKIWIYHAQTSIGIAKTSKPDGI